MISRYPSRLDRIDRLLTGLLPGATQYDRIASLPHREADVHAARLLLGAVENDAM